MEKTWWQRITCGVELAERDRRNLRTLHLLNKIGVFDGSPSDGLMFMVVAYSLSVTLGWRRYR